MSRKPDDLHWPKVPTCSHERTRLTWTTRPYGMLTGGLRFVLVITVQSVGLQISLRNSSYLIPSVLQAFEMMLIEISVRGDGNGYGRVDVAGYVSGG